MLFVQSAKSGVSDPLRDFFDNYHMPLAEIKGFNVLINNKKYFERLIKSKQELYDETDEMSKNNDYTTANLIDLLYHQNYYKLIVRELSRQTNTSIAQQINIIGILKEANDTARFVSLKSSKKLF